MKTKCRRNEKKEEVKKETKEESKARVKFSNTIIFNFQHH